jgi:ribosome-associated protein
MPESERKAPDEVSKSSIKREMTAMQKIGEALVALPPSQLEKVPLPENLYDAVKFARTLKTGESIRRQMQYIGKIMRNVDIEPIKIALNKIKLSHERVTNEFHEVETWRDKLITEGDDAIQIFLQQHPTADRQQLRQLVRKAQHDRKTGKNSGAETELFRVLRELL